MRNAPTFAEFSVSLWGSWYTARRPSPAWAARRGKNYVKPSEYQRGLKVYEETFGLPA